MYSYNRGKTSYRKDANTTLDVEQQSQGPGWTKAFLPFFSSFEEVFCLKGNTEIQENLPKLPSRLTEEDSLAPRGHFVFLYQSPDILLCS